MDKENDVIVAELCDDETEESPNNELKSKLRNAAEWIIAFFAMIHEFFMDNAFLRNIVWFGLNLLTTYVAVMGIVYCWSNAASKNATYWWILVGYFLLSFVLSLIATRLGVIRVCPNCSENRAIRKKEEATGNTQYGAVRSNKREGGYEQEIREEYRNIEECIYGCGYYQESTYWKSKWNKVE